MKTKTLIIGLVIALITSCASPLSSRLNDYVNEVESSCLNWTEEDWELSQEEYAKLLEEYELNYDSYTQEEKDAINKAIGRYNGLLIKQGIEEAGSVFKEFGERLPSLIEGFMSVLRSFHQVYIVLPLNFASLRLSSTTETIRCTSSGR